MPTCFANLLRRCLQALLLVAPAIALGTGALLSGYERDIDQRIVQAIAVGEGDSDVVIVTKQYLEGRKAAVNPEVAKRITYETRYVADGKAATINTYVKEVAPEVAQMSWANNGVMIPVIRQGEEFDLFHYQRNKDVIRRLEMPEAARTNGRLDGVFALRDGYVTVSSVEAASAVAFYGYDGRKARPLDFGDEAGRILSIEDVAQFDSGVCMLVTSREPGGDDALSLWLVRFDSQLTADSRVGTRLLRESAFALSSRFVSSTHEFPSALIASRASVLEPPTVKLFALGATPKLVKEFAAERLEGEPNVAIAGICDDEYAVAKRLFRDGSVSKEIDFQIFDSGGKAKRAWQAEMIDRGSLVDVSLMPYADGLLALVNFNQFEEARRKNGWYSWLGYRLDKFDVRQDCDWGKSAQGQ